MDGTAECWSNDFVYNSAFIATNTWTDFVFPNAGSGSPACGLTNDGFIQCWSTAATLPAPDNGPYTQIETNSIFFCGLQTDGNPDCIVREFGGTTAIDSTNQTTLASIESLPPLVDMELRSSGPSSISFCSIDFNGKLLCVGNALPADNLPGEQLDIPRPFDLDFTIYSESAGELFWVTALNSFSSPISGFNVYRNDELLSFTTGNASYFDDELQTNTSYVYQVSMVLLDGRESQRSEPFTVLTDNEQPTPGNTNNTPNYLLTDIDLMRYSGSTLELFWASPNSNTLISHYDVFRNGEYQATTPGPSFFDDTVASCDSYEYTIAAISGDDQIIALGFQSEEVFPAATCP